jgi:cyclopropane fatty-acyl-phospholipid synthase-like methyltransferase
LLASLVCAFKFALSNFCFEKYELMDDRQYAPATQRNRQGILKILSEVLPPGSNVLEIASGTGEHATFFASRLESCHWIPSDVNALARKSIIAWQNACPGSNLELPLLIDVIQDNWQQEVLHRQINAIVNINMIHIAPWQAWLGLIDGASKLLPEGGILYLYGPFKRNGEHTAPSNESFDRSLRDRNPLWGVRDLEEIITTAAAQNLTLQQVIAMPANNLSVIFNR